MRKRRSWVVGCLLAAALVSGCGTSQPPSGAPSSGADAPERTLTVSAA